MHPAQFPVHISVLGQPVIHRQCRAHQVTTMSSDHQSAAQLSHCVACWVDDVQKCFTDKAVIVCCWLSSSIFECLLLQVVGVQRAW